MEDTPRVVEGEVLGHETEPPRPFQAGGVLARLALALLLSLVGLGLFVVGILLTLSIVGAVWGLPLMFLGALMAGAAGLILFGGGRLRVSAGRWPGGFRKSGGHDRISS